ncbi:Jag family protein [Knoellia aerolata]|uniref:Jag n=1 Tax=Knoellia aerolata DSM 18566 TaxID=1385519 RepID=A0A0A0JTJ9_9MICO|nr:R3H domain-containing nucleic acid-binding protein [Knoellia aerolata]KGN40760.1 Jag [Knoellia aerolata DSM 18566]
MSDTSTPHDLAEQEESSDSADESTASPTPTETTDSVGTDTEDVVSGEEALASTDEADGDGAGAGDTAEGSSEPSAPADLEKEGEVAADFLENLLDICDLDGDIDVDIDGDRAAVAIVDSEDGRVPRRLVGENAKVLDALQELTRLAVQSATGHRSRLMLDVAGHRAGRRAELVEVAKDAIEAVRQSGEKTALEPMTAFERKVVHDEVLAAGLVSESEGVEPRRHVVVLPA